MAKILISTISGIANTQRLPCFYEGFVNTLLREGNDIMLMISNHFLVDCWNTNKLLPSIDEHKLSEEIKEFNPDLVISFNHSLYEKIPQILECPIIVWGVDSAPAFVAKEDIKKNLSRYKFIGSSEGSTKSFIEYFNMEPKKIHTIYFATDFKAEPITQSKNIVFTGTNFSNSGRLKNIFYNNFTDKEIRNNFIKFINIYKSNVLKKPDIFLHELGIESELLKSIPHMDFLNILSSNFRNQTLLAIQDLGLQLYGSKNWYDTIDLSLDLALCYNEQDVSSIQENQDIYNQSKLAINITHFQNEKSFGWRVRDIMATNACLISDYRQDLVTLFEKYVKIPTYTTPYEARKLCKNLLEDEAWRQEIVAGSQLAIEKEHRFKHRLEALESYYDIKLFSKEKGKLLQLHPEDFLKEQKSELKSEIIIEHSVNKNKFKTFIENLLLIFKENSFINPVYKNLIKILLKILLKKLKKINVNFLSGDK